jgi:L-ribulokinase
MFAATAAGLYPRIEGAQRAMASAIETAYHPDPERATLYESLYRDYLALGAFVENTLTRAPSQEI